MKMAKKGQVSAVVEVSPWQEDATPALESVRDLPQVYDVHVVCSGGFAHPLLAELDKPVEVHGSGKLDASKLGCRAAIHLGADVSMTPAAAEALIEDMTTTEYDHYAISTPLIIERDDITLAALWGSLAYGFLLVLMVLDTLRSALTWFRHHRAADVRATLVYHSYPKRAREAHPPSRWRWWIWTRVHPLRRLDGTTGQVPAPPDQGWALLWRTIYTHRQLGPDLWWPPAFGFYYWLFALPWWRLWLGKTLIAGSYLWWTPEALHYLLVAYVAHQHMTTPYWPVLVLQVVLYPVYLSLAPLIYVFMRWWPVRAQLKRE